MKPSYNFVTLSLVLILLIAGSLYYGLTFKQQASPRKMKVVAITQIVQHPSLDKIRQGVIDALASQGFKEGQNLKLIYENAQGNISIATQIAQSFVGENPDAIVAITTPSAQAVLSVAKGTGIPIVYGAVTDPVGAKLISSLKTPSSQVTGTYDQPPAKEQIALIQQFLPHAQKIGIIYNPGEVNNVFQVGLMKKAAQKRGLTVIESTASKSADIANVAHFIARKVDAILLPNDNTVIASLESIIRAANEAKIPVFTSDPESIERGAVAAVAFDQYKIGLQTGEIVADILNGKKVSSILSQKVTDARIYKRDSSE